MTVVFVATKCHHFEGEEGMKDMKGIDKFKGVNIYFKSNDGKHKIGRIVDVYYSEVWKDYIVEANCSGEKSLISYSSEEEIERSISIGEQLLEKRREKLESFFGEGKDKEMIDLLKKQLDKGKKKGYLKRKRVVRDTLLQNRKKK